MFLGNPILKILFLFYSIDAAIIKNAGAPSCKKCVHYNPSFYSEYSSDLNRCKYFGTKNIQSDEIEYDFASLCRGDENKCGLNGKYFEQEANVEFKILLHSFVKNLPMNMCFFILFINSYISILNKK